jgi:ATP-dependent Clp protease adapter protein ClpS
LVQTDDEGGAMNKVEYMIGSINSKDDKQLVGALTKEDYVFYHGTLAEYVPQILQEGLKPVEHNAWRVVMEEGAAPLRETEPVDSVFLTQDMVTARNYATAKVRYFATKPGEEFYFSAFQLMFKTLDAPQQNGLNPAVLEVHLTEEELVQLEPDWRSLGSVKFAGTLPPERIQAYVTPQGYFPLRNEVEK